MTSTSILLAGLGLVLVVAGVVGLQLSSGAPLAPSPSAAAPEARAAGRSETPVGFSDEKNVR